jgi:hypothetical protein
MQFRISIRWLLFLTVLANATCLWQFAMPTIIAERFRVAIARADYAAADAMCGSSVNGAFATMMHQFQDDPSVAIKANVRIDPWSWHDFWQRRRQLEISFSANRDFRQFLCRPWPKPTPGSSTICVRRIYPVENIGGRNVYRLSLTVTPQGIEDVETGQRQ